MKLYIIGVGPGSMAYITPAALKMIEKADVVVTTKRLFHQLGGLNSNTISCSLTDIVPTLKGCEHLPMGVILVSGDVGFYSLSNTLKATLGEYQVEWINGISSLQYLAAKLQLDYSHVKVVSVHGRETSVVPAVCYHPWVFVLTGGKYKAHHVVQALCEAGLGSVTVTVGENLSEKKERLVTASAEALESMCWEDLAVVMIENPGCVSCTETLTDEDFCRGKVPMTKEEVRSVTLAKLDVQPKDLVYDIGAGTGSVAIAMARKAFEHHVYAVEKKQEAITLLEKNRQQWGAFNMKIVQGTAPSVLHDLPAPDKVFIGGAGGEIAPTVALLLKKNHKVRIVVNAVTLETLHETVECFEANEMNVNIVCVGITGFEKKGRYHMAKAQNPIYVVTGEKT